MPRPTKYSAALRTKLVAEVRAGAELRAAAVSCGIGERTLRRWRAARPAFAEELERARVAYDAEQWAKWRAEWAARRDAERVLAAEIHKQHT
jgi:hypothetical protein